MYTVKAGDTLSSIAIAELGYDGWQYLASINSISSPYVVTPGQQLLTDVPTVEPSHWPWLLLLGAFAGGGIWWYNKKKKKR